MKSKIAFGLLLCALFGFVLGTTHASKTATWADPEPKGIIAIKK